jgi:hypothetical protein
MNRPVAVVTRAARWIFTRGIGFSLLLGASAAFAGIPVPRQRPPAQPAEPATEPPPEAQPARAPAETPPNPSVMQPPAKQPATSTAAPATPTQTTGVTVDVSPQATGQSRLAPAGTANGSTTPLTNDTGQVQNPPASPTPPGFPFGAPGGSYAPAGPSASGPTPGFRMTR